ncbi:MAG: hypothetical protein AAGU75_07695 [Bacillota bacterium]
MPEVRVIKDNVFFVSKRTKKFTAFILFFSSLCYIICKLIENKQSLLSSTTEYGSDYFLIFATLKDLSLIVTTLIASSFLSRLFIETKDKNDIVENCILGEILESPKFYEYLSDERKRDILNHLEQELYFRRTPMLDTIYKSIRSKLPGFQDKGYYFQQYEVIITCDIYDDRIVKKVKRITDIRSFQESFTVENYQIARNACSNAIKDDNIRNLKVYIGKSDKAIESSCIKIDSHETQNQLMKKSGYDWETTCTLLKPLKLMNDTSTKLTIEYETTVSIKDSALLFRVPVPCEECSIQYKINSKTFKNYRLVSCAFGLNDTAEDSPNDDTEDTVNIKFNDWIFPEDGAVIIIEEK